LLQLKVKMPGTTSYISGRPAGFSDEDDSDDDFYGVDDFGGAGRGDFLTTAPQPRRDEWQRQAYGDFDPIQTGEGHANMSVEDRLRRAVSNDDAAAVAALLDVEPDAVKACKQTIDYAATPVAVACANGAAQALAVLLDRGASSAPDPSDGSSPLMALASAVAPPELDTDEFEHRLVACAKVLIAKRPRDAQVDGRQSQVRASVVFSSSIKSYIFLSNIIR
jgi:hypothetical protein